MTAPFVKRKVDTSRILTAARESLSNRSPQSGELEVGKVYDVPLTKIRPNPSNSRAFYPSVPAQQLQKSLLEQGQNVAACGFLDLAGDVVLIDGHRRLFACEQIGWATLRVEIRPLPENEQALYLASRSANLDREDQTPLDDAVVWRRLLDRNVFTSQTALSRALGLTETQVSRTLSLNELPSKVTHTLFEYPEFMTFKMLNAIRELSKVQSEDKTLIFVIEAAKEGLSYREVESRRKALEQGPKKRARSFRRDISLLGAKGVLKTFETGGRLELSVKGLTPEQTEEALEKLEGLFRS